MTAGTFSNFTMTWSEAPFTLFIILLSIQLGAMLSAEQPVNGKNLVILTALFICTFLSRYIGLYTVGAASVIALIIFRRGRQSDAVKIFFSTIIAFSFAVAYLVLNKALTGYATGMPRIPTSESNLDLGLSLLISLGREFVLPLAKWKPRSIEQSLVIAIWCLALLLMLRNLLRASTTIVDLNKKDYCSSFIIIGVTYLGAIIFARLGSSPVGGEIVS